jgi:uncharacterized RDD family membrane protein YckC
MAVQLGRLELETPDHVVLRYDLAGGGNRGFAALVDAVIASLVVAGSLFVTSYAVRFLGLAGLQLSALITLVAILIAWSYYILLEWLWQGQTVGKRFSGLRVIREDGAPAGFVAILIRNLVRLVDFLPGFYGLGLMVIILSPRSQRLGDIAAGTYVVRAPRPQLDYFSLRTVSPITAGATVETRALPGEVQRLVREFVAREAKLRPPDRQRVAAQIAERVRPYARDLITIGDDVELLRAVARSLRATGGDR